MADKDFQRIQANRGFPVQVPETLYNYARGVLPPISSKSGMGVRGITQASTMTISTTSTKKLPRHQVHLAHQTRYEGLASTGAAGAARSDTLDRWVG